MKITEVRIKLMEDPDDRLQAFCSITIDDWFVIRDLKIIEGTAGTFVAMPSRKLTSHCRKCRFKNHLRANFCNQCGGKVSSDTANRDSHGRIKLYADIAHPINSDCREEIQKAVLTELAAELELAKSPDYTTRYDDAYGDYQPERDEAGSTSKTASNAAAKASQAKTRTHRIESEQSPDGPHRTQKNLKQSNADKTEGAGGFGAGIFDS